MMGVEGGIGRVLGRLFARGADDAAEVASHVHGPRAKAGWGEASRLRLTDPSVKGVRELAPMPRPGARPYEPPTIGDPGALRMRNQSFGGAVHRPGPRSWAPVQHPPIRPVNDASEAIALLDEWAPPSKVLTRRATEVPYGVPDGFEVTRIKLGDPVPVGRLDPEKVYLWTLDEAGTIHVAPETQPGFGVNDLVPDGRRLKHGDLTPSADRLERGEARMGGKFKVLRDRWGSARQASDGAYVWEMNNSSSYVGARAKEVDGRLVQTRRLDNDALIALREVMEFGGTDTSHLRLKAKFGGTLWKGSAKPLPEPTSPPPGWKPPPPPPPQPQPRAGIGFAGDGRIGAPRRIAPMGPQPRVGSHPAIRERALAEDVSTRPLPRDLGNEWAPNWVRERDRQRAAARAGFDSRHGRADQRHEPLLTAGEKLAIGGTVVGLGGLIAIAAAAGGALDGDGSGRGSDRPRHDDGGRRWP